MSGCGPGLPPRLLALAVAGRHDGRVEAVLLAAVLAELGIPDLPGASCAGLDSWPWFTNDPADLAMARRVCRGCPQRAACLDWSLAHEVPHGMWGGLTGPQRARLRGRTRP